MLTGKDWKRMEQESRWKFLMQDSQKRREREQGRTILEE